MGAYLCIAQNKVPPSISKRIILNVECKYPKVFNESKDNGKTNFRIVFILDRVVKCLTVSYSKK